MEELIGLHNLPRNNSAKKRKVRRGRGNASGGNYSGRGMKGQRARSGGKSGLKYRGMKSYLLRIPKKRGFSTDNIVYIPINLSVLETHFQKDEQVSLRSLLVKGLIAKDEKNVKLLAGGKVTKSLKVKLPKVSKAAREAIEKVGGEIIISPAVKEPSVKKKAKQKK
ncbi:MAG: 50S ribosomal protein L15 [Candidatus Komeilibacteria bacterium]|nr:50S ribosomal protein L15 [Candidatus Komeilibacteria bacterium]